MTTSPGATRECVELTVPVSDQLFDFREQVRVRPAPVEQRDLMTPIQRALDHMRSDEAGATEDQDAEVPGLMLGSHNTCRAGAECTRTGPSRTRECCHSGNRSPNEAAPADRHHVPTPTCWLPFDPRNSSENWRGIGRESSRHGAAGSPGLAANLCLPGLDSLHTLIGS